MTPAATPIARLSVATTTATVMTIVTVSLIGMRRKVLGLTLFQSKVTADTKIMTATRAPLGMSADRVAQNDDEDEQKEPGGEGGQPAAGTGFDVDHGLPDHRARGHAAEETGDDVGDALAARLTCLVRRRVCGVVDDLRGP